MLMLQEFRARLEPAGEGRSMTARVVPFSEVIDHDGLMQVDPGSVRLPADGTVIPLTIDHVGIDGGTLERIGKLSRWFEDDDAGYAEFDISETSVGSDVLTLLHDGVLTDVSMGVIWEKNARVDEHGVAHPVGMIHHVGVVGSGAFGKAGAGSKVLAVHNEKEPIVADNETVTAPVVTYDDSDMKAEIVRLADKVDAFDTKVVDEPSLFENFRDYSLARFRAARGEQDSIDLLDKSDKHEMAQFAMSADTTTTSAGLVPDNLLTQIIGLLEGSRPSVDAFGKLPAGDSGMNVVLPKVNTKAVVAAQSSEFDQPNSTQMAIATDTFALETYAGANRVSMQLVERSSPAFVDRLFAELISSYATVTDAAFNAALVAGVGTNTAIVADLSTSASATYAAIVAGVGAIAGDIKRPADRLILGSTRWTQLMSLLDADDRPLITHYGPVNAPGMPKGSNAWTFNYFPGLVGIHDPHAAATSCLIAWSGAAASIETSPARLQVTAVDTLSMDFGIWGLFTDAILYGGNTGGLYSITAS